MISSKEMKYEQDNPVPNGTVCTALYDALPEYHIDLDFKKGDKVVIVEPCNVLFFYIGQNEERKSGVIPINYFTFEAKSGDDQGDPEPTGNREGNRYVTSHSPQVQIFKCALCVGITADACSRYPSLIDSIGCYDVIFTSGRCKTSVTCCKPKDTRFSCAVEASGRTKRKQHTTSR